MTMPGGGVAQMHGHFHSPKLSHGVSYHARSGRC